jgi:hypothetical protein
MTGEHYTNSEISLPARRRRRAAPNWSRHPAPQAPKSISQLLAERDFAARVATVDPTPKNRLADRAACEALGEARLRAAREFGELHQWRLARRGFRIGDLCARERGHYYLCDLQPDYPLVDHPAHYRWADGYQPAALVAQPYKAAFQHDQAQAFADKHGLLFHVVEGFESWWWPGQCLIVVWEKGYPPRRDQSWGAL